MAFVDAISDAEIRDVYGYWLRKRAGGRIPLKSSIDPVEVGPGLLPNLFMYRLEGDRFRCILVGTAIVRNFGRDVTGMFLDEIVPAPHAASRQRLFERAVRDRLPVYYAGPAVVRTRERRRVSRLLLPLSSDGTNADHVFGIAMFGPAEDRAREDMRLNRPDEPPAIIAVASEEDLDEPGA